ncbi:hypothetical protein F5Y16DRAFT_405101 [Xylariaceae sp. FL0255]|nr:hypothetical protein F5Y16DRAFT_405101 [Xylariaceae sp. FL0255]
MDNRRTERRDPNHPTNTRTRTAFPDQEGPGYPYVFLALYELIIQPIFAPFWWLLVGVAIGVEREWISYKRAFQTAGVERAEAGGGASEAGSDLGSEFASNAWSSEGSEQSHEGSETAIDDEEGVQQPQYLYLRQYLLTLLTHELNTFTRPLTSLITFLTTYISLWILLALITTLITVLYWFFSSFSCSRVVDDLFSTDCDWEWCCRSWDDFYDAAFFRGVYENEGRGGAAVFPRVRVLVNGTRIPLESWVM